MKRLTAFYLLLGTVLWAQPPETKPFSQIAWEKTAPIYAAIVKHPFNAELAEGTLGREKFAYYSAQDAKYLTTFGKALAILATKLDDPEATAGLFQEAASCLKEEEKADLEKAATADVEIGPATQLYTDFLLATSAYKSREELTAAVLPCFWIYYELAKELKGRVTPKNPYYRWVKLYSSEKYRRSVDKMVALADHLASQASPEQRLKMLDAFVLASRMEWYFWDEAYRMAGWKPN